MRLQIAALTSVLSLTIVSSVSALSATDEEDIIASAVSFQTGSDDPTQQAQVLSDSESMLINLATQAAYQN